FEPDGERSCPRGGAVGRESRDHPARAAWRGRCIRKGRTGRERARYESEPVVLGWIDENPISGTGDRASNSGQNASGDGVRREWTVRRSAPRLGGSVHRFHGGAECRRQRLTGLDDAHAHLERQRPAGGVVRQIVAHVGVLLDLEYLAHEFAEFLVEGNDPGPLWVRRAVVGDVAIELVNAN